MGMEVRATTVTKYNWPALTYNKWIQPDTINETTDDSVLSQSAPTCSTFFNNSTCRRAASFPAAALAFPTGDLHVRSQSESCGLNNISIKVPRKPIFQQQDIKLAPSPKNKCRVRFADECGETLSIIRVLTEPSDYPPQIPVEVLRRHRKAAGMEDVDDTPKPKSTWKVLFKQPASEYVRFRHKLETSHVALENAIIKNDIPKMIGTIKVGNIAFEKKVYLRCTSDNWQSFKDYDAKFQVSASKAFDTFTFDIPLPSNVGLHDSHFEFCICYKTNGVEEFWDSNEGKNYNLGSDEPVVQPPASPPPPQSKTSPIIEPKPLPMAKQRAQFNDAYNMNFGNHWADFSSWKNLSVENPYW
ncbi:Protein phosphatase 1 regulatory subunit [Aphelenchoides bicaudatus]|nr:Protein phosphatase 1 regulatory subunit [Aphelenchoides bicaudatus]